MSFIDDLIERSFNALVKEKQNSAEEISKQSQDIEREKAAQAERANTNTYLSADQVRWTRDPLSGQPVPDRRTLTRAEHEQANKEAHLRAAVHQAALDKLHGLRYNERGEPIHTIENVFGQ